MQKAHKFTFYPNNTTARYFWLATPYIKTFSTMPLEANKTTLSIGFLSGIFLGLIFWQVTEFCVHHMACYLYTRFWSSPNHRFQRCDFVTKKNGTNWRLHFFSNWTDDAYMGLATSLGECTTKMKPLALVFYFAFFGLYKHFANQICQMFTKECNLQHPTVTMTMLVIGTTFFVIFCSDVLDCVHSCLAKSSRYKAIKAGISTEQYPIEPSTAPTDSITDFSDSSFNNESGEMDDDSSAAIETTFIENMALLSQ
jgi:hypothetical protein